MVVTNEVKKEEKVLENKTNKKQFLILGYSVWRLLAYFIIYSFVGYVLETLYGMITKGVWESRQSFLYGPFCAIYGLGAIIMILLLQFFNKNNNTLFIGGFIIGSAIEYFVSLFGELLLHVKWWDYSDMPFNLNGRICIFFSIFWGLLGIYLISYVNPKIDKLLNFIKRKFSTKFLKILTITVNTLFVLDCAVTMYALGAFFARIVYKNDLNVPNKEIIDIQYQKIYSNENKVKLIEKYFNDEKMLKTFPNLKLSDVDGNIIYFDYLLPDIQPYYYKLNNKLRGDFVNILKQDNVKLNSLREKVKNEEENVLNTIKKGE